MKLVKEMEVNGESVQLNGTANNTNKQDYLIEYEHVKDTPFTIVSKEERHFGVMGQHQITKVEEDKEKLRKELKKITWNRLIQVIAIIKENDIK